MNTGLYFSLRGKAITVLEELGREGIHLITNIYGYDGKM